MGGQKGIRRGGFVLAQVESEAVYAGRGRCYEDRGEISTGVGDFLVADQGGQRAEGRERGTRIKRGGNVRNPDAASDTFSAY